MGQVAPLRTARVVLHACRVAGLAGALALMAQTPVAAQGLGWLGGIFGGGGQTQPRQSGGYPSYPTYPGYPSYQPAPSYGYGYTQRQPTYRRGYSDGEPYYPRPRAARRRAVEPVPKEAAAEPQAPKKDATIFVDVFGDSLGQLLANGLDDALIDRQDVAVVHKAKGSTGLVQTDFYDWPKTIEGLLASQEPPGKDTKGKEAAAKSDGAAKPAGKPAPTAPQPATAAPAPKEKIDVAVMMIGSNDRQPITENGKVYPVESDEWSAAYKKRVVAIDEAFLKRGIPIVWVGVPITHDTDFANDMAAFNDIYREAAAKTGAVYVDTWEAFSDDNGAFDAYGPDINGQTVRLRSADGIHFTKAGARKLAHFVEAHIRRALDGKVPPVELPTADAPATTKSAPPAAPKVAAIKPEAGPITNLNEAPTAANGELATAARSGGAPELDRVVQSSLVKGEPQAPPKGRVDDFRWPRPPAQDAPR